MRSGLYALLALPACYAPSIVAGVPCEPSAPSCPMGQTCQASADGFVCLARDAGGQGDAGVDVPMPPDGGVCLGNHLLGSVCLSRAPTAPVTLSSAAPINSASVTPGGCTEILPQSGGPSLCIIAGTTITVSASVTVRGFGVNPAGTAGAGTNPLVLIATQSIDIQGTLDVASHVGEVIAGMPVLGAGARSAIGCAAINLDGTQGRPANQDSSFGGGGGAGGSLGSLGGTGGAGGNGNQVAPGNPVAGIVPALLVGGCPGGNGGNGDGTGGGGGLGGGGGGAVYLLAGDSITISGKINASGAGGGKGSAGMFSSGGGGGAGSGGMIGLEAPRIMVTAPGTLFANGGGGASGSGGDETDTGTSGSDPSVAMTAAPGAPGNNGGGAGGNGSVGAAPGSIGRNGSGQFREAAGGGGGGGAGVIRVFGVAPSSVTGAISPPPT
jgi:hypothetical protein